MGWGLLLLKGRLLQGVFLALFCGAVQGIWISHGKSSNPYEKYANAYKGLVEGPQELERSLPRDDFTTKGVQGNTLEVGTIVRAQWRQGETWYTGHVDLVNPDGTVDIQFDDG